MSTFYFSPTGRGGNAMRFRKRKSRFTFDEVQLLLNEVKNNRHIVIGKFNRGVSSDVKKRTWAAITARINEISECPREVIEIIKKWSDLKCDTKRKVAAMRAGTEGSLRPGSSRIARDLSPVENMVYQILQLPPLDNRAYRRGWTGMGTTKGAARNRDCEEDEEEEEDDILLRMARPSTSVGSSQNGRLDGPGLLTSTVGLTVPMTVPVSMPVPSPSIPHKRDVCMPTPIYSREAPQTAYDFQYEIPGPEDQVVELDSDEDRQDATQLSSFVPPLAPNEEEQVLGDLRHTVAMASTSSSLSVASAPSLAQPSSCGPPPPVLPPSSPGPGNARDRLAQHALLSVQEQRNTNVLMESVSRSLEMLSESVQQLVETQQEFVRNSLRLQRETVHILRDFSTSVLAAMHDKLNGRPAP